MKKKHWYDYLWIWTIVYFALGFFNILFAWLGMIDFLVPLFIALFGGSKAFCIGELLKKGYDPDKVLMCGDAPGDLAAAEKNGVGYYPILVRREKESWQEFMDEGFAHLLDGSYAGAYQEKKKAEFLKNLGA